MLWTLVLISLLVSTIAASGSGRTRQAADLKRNAQLRAEADGGVEEAVFHLLDGSKAHWPADGAVHVIKRGDTVLTMRIDTEAGKVNPNRASQDLLAGLFQALGLDSRTALATATRMIVWRFAGAQGAAEHGDGRDYLPPGAPFESIPEVGLVAGITPSLLARLAPHLSLYRDNDPEPASADPVVQQAMAIAAGTGDTARQNAIAGSNQQGNNRDESVVSVISEAKDATGRRFVRRAIVLVGSDPQTRGKPDQRPFQIMTWDAPAA
ncbi:type II secretion system protein GspK [Lichenicola cladoniae]|uniref:type II secretion system protein GspK n=1 Tax=Lichenicola cladoniae TaxID=1484109 RepID=UPI001EF654A5|nr:type II secretion system protein GspK [Lichenicola cladoniae]